MTKSSLRPALALALVTALCQFDVTATAVALPMIQRDLRFPIAGAAWVVDAYSLAFAGLLLASGALADRHGRRRALLFGNAGFAAASLACALAWDGPSLWAARALQGAAAAFLITGGLASLSVAYPSSGGSALARARAFGVMGVTSGMAMALGPTLGGWLAAGFGWRAIFLVNLPICALAAILVPRLVAESREPNGRPLDWRGVALLSIGLTLCVHALLAAESALTLRWVEAGCGVLAGAAFLRHQRGLAKPVFDPVLFLSPGAIAVGCQLAALSVGYWAVLVFAPTYLSAVHGLTIDQAGPAMLSATLPMVALPPVGAWIARRWGWRVALTGGMATTGIGAGALAWAAASASPLAAALTGLTICGVGAGLINAQLSGAMVAMAPPAQAGTAASVAVTLRQGGFAVGVALLGALAETGAETGGEPFAASFALASAAGLAGACVAWRLLRAPR